MIRFTIFRPDARQLLGYLPSFLDEQDERPIAEQLDSHYQHGGGWRPMSGWEYDAESGVIEYPGDEPLAPIASTEIRDETMLVYDYAWVVIAQKDGSFQIARMD